MVLERVVLHGRIVIRRAASSSPARQQVRSDGQAAWGKRRPTETAKTPKPPHAPKPLTQANTTRKAHLILPRVNRPVVQGVGPNGEPIVLLNGTAATATAEDSLARPSWKTLQLVALQRGVPFIGFGFVDNAIMIVSGDYIEMNIGVALGIGTMTAAALGNIVADVIGLNLGGMIEEASYRMGIPEPKLSKQQMDMGLTKVAAYSGTSLGIAFGCLLGMLPLLFLVDDVREGTPADVCNALAQRAVDLLQCERAVVYHVDASTKKIIQQYNSSEQPGLTPGFSRELTQQVLYTEEGAALAVIESAEVMEGRGGSSELAETTIGTEREDVRSLLSMPVLDQKGKVIAIVTAINRKRDGNQAREGFGPEDYKTMAGVCAQVAESIINLSRRPEEHVSLTENLGLLRLHSHLPIKPFTPSLAALMGRDAKGYQHSSSKGIILRTEQVPIGSGQMALGRAATPL